MFHRNNNHSKFQRLYNILLCIFQLLNLTLDCQYFMKFIIYQNYNLILNLS